MVRGRGVHQFSAELTTGGIDFVHSALRPLHRDAWASCFEIECDGVPSLVDVCSSDKFETWRRPAEVE